MKVFVKSWMGLFLIIMMSLGHPDEIWIPKTSRPFVVQFFLVFYDGDSPCQRSLQFRQTASDNWIVFAFLRIHISNILTLHFANLQTGFCVSMRSFDWKYWTIEQKWTVMLLVLLLFFYSEFDLNCLDRTATRFLLTKIPNAPISEKITFGLDPLHPLVYLLPGWIPQALDGFFQLSFYSFLLLFWLCVFDALRAVSE